jgi:hypothetical protein
MNKRRLWLNIAHYHFDNLVPVNLWDEIVAKFEGENPFTKAFADKLSRKLQWEKSFALSAIWEYKKSVFLGVISDFSVTPSKVIDMVWHEHLLFSSGYRKFCQEIIQFDFDHNPELVSIGSQTEAFQAQYFQTIELYKKEFGMEPPSEIWGVTKFDGKLEYLNKPTNNQNDSGYSDSYVGTDPLISTLLPAESIDIEFGEGEFGGGGNDDSWDDSGEDSDGSSGDGSDSGSSCSSCSSCSSGCGGGGD